MGILRRFKNAVKAFGSGDFYNNDSPYSGGFVDRWGKQKVPNRAQLLQEFKGTAFACSNLNTQGVIKTNLRLYQKAKQGQKLLYPVKGLLPWASKYVQDTSKVRVSGAEKLVEITQHPILDLLRNPNPTCDAHTLFEFTQLFQEVCGAAYWYCPRNVLDTPAQIYLLLPQYVYPITDKATGMPMYYEYGTADNKVRYELDEIIPFLAPNLMLPWLDGFSPLMSVFEQVSVEDKLISTEQALFDNEARPSGMLSVKDGIGADMADRLERRFNNKLRKAGAGGVIVSEDDVTFTPLNYNPRDLARLEIHEHTIKSICNAYGVPMALLADSSGSQYNVHETLLLQHVETAICPRLCRNQSVLNQYLLKHFDSSGNLFLAYDDPSPRNKEFELDQTIKLVGAGVTTPNEERIARGLPPVEGGDSLAGMYSQDAPESDKPSKDDEAADQAEDKPEDNSSKPGGKNPPKPPTAGDNKPKPDDASDTPAKPEPAEGDGKADLLDPYPALAILTSYGKGDISRETAIALLMACFGISRQEAEKLVADTEAPTDSANKGLSKAHTIDNEGHGLYVPTGAPLVDVLKRYFQRQQKQILDNLSKSLDEAHTKGIKADLPSHFVPLDEWDTELYEDSQPLIRIEFQDSYEREGKQLVAQTGCDPDVFDVTNPKLEHEIKKLTLTFCEETNACTTKELNDALADLRNEFAEGLLEGDRMHELRKRVQSVFTNADDYRAERIARTEASRSYHAAQRAADIDSGVVTGWKWMLSSKACDKCKAVASKTIGLTGSFHHDADAPAPYRDIKAPPLHPHCVCALESLIEGVSESGEVEGG